MLFLLLSTHLAFAQPNALYTKENIEGVYQVTEKNFMVIRRLGENLYHYYYACTTFTELGDPNRRKLVCGQFGADFSVGKDGMVEVEGLQSGKFWMDPAQPSVLFQSKIFTEPKIAKRPDLKADEAMVPLL